MTYPQVIHSVYTGYPQDIHNLRTVYPQVIHSVYTGYPQLIHRLSTVCRVVQSGTETVRTDGFKAGYRALSQRSPVTETTVQSTVQRGNIETV